MSDDPHDSWDADAFKATIGTEAFKTAVSGNHAVDNAEMPAAALTSAAPKLNKAVEDVKEGDVSSLASRKVVYGAAREAMLKRQELDMAIAATDWDRPEAAGRRPSNTTPTPAVEGGKPMEKKEASGEFAEAKAEWKEARDRSDKLEKEFDDKYQVFLTSESKGWRRVANLPRRLFGLQPKLNPELQALQGASQIARREYVEKGKQLKDLKPGREGAALGKVAAVAAAFRNGEAVAAESKALSVGELERTEKLLARYQRMLTHKAIIGVHEKRIGIQERVAAEAAERGPMKRLQPALEVMRKYRYVRWGTMAVGYGVLAGATGGVGAAALAGGGYLARVGGAMALGSYGGTLWRAGGERLARQSRADLERAQTAAKENLFDRDFLAMENEIANLTAEADQIRAATKTGAAAIAMGAGFAGGMVTGEVADALHAGQAAGALDAPPTASAEPTTPPSSGSSPYEGGMISGPGPESAAPVEPPAHAPGEGGAEQAPVRPATPAPAEAPIDDESMEDYEGRVYNVQPGDNLWNILEGKGPDAHPVGGQSDVLKGMGLAERQAALKTLFDYMDSDPEFAKAAGIVQSGGNIDKIYPGEHIDISMLDEKLRDLLGLNTELPEHPPIPTPRPETMSAAPAAVEPSLEPAAVPETITDVNDLTVGQVIDLAKDVALMKPEAAARLAELGMDTDTFMDMFHSLNDRVTAGALDQSQTVREFLNTTTEMPHPAPAAENVPAVTPFDGHIPQPGETPVREASFAPEAVNDNQAAVQAYVQNIEKGTSGFLFRGQPDIGGTFDKLSGLTFKNIGEIAANDNLETAAQRLGVSPEGYSRWMEKLQEEVAKTPPLNETETVGQYVGRLNGRQAAA